MGRPAGRKARITETRSTDTRTNKRREMPHAQHVGKLFVPVDEIPPGMTYSWVDVGQGTQFQEPNTIRADEQSAKGWTPVPRSRHPKFRSGGSLIPGRAETDPYAQFVKVGASLLCERPTKDVEQEKMEQLMATSDQVRSIGRWRSGEGADPVMPRFDESSDVQRSYAEIKKD